MEYEEQKKAMENFRYAVHSLERGLWDEALEYVTAAIEGDSHSKGYKLDWHFHWLKGELLLGAPARHDWPGLDPAAAERCFALAAKYARQDAPREAARALLMASVAAYASSADEPAALQAMLDHAEAAWTLDGSLTEAAFQVSRARMLLDRPQEALHRLRMAIEQDPLFAVRAAEDPGHRRHQEALDGFLRALREEAARDVGARARQASQVFEPLAGRSPELADLPELVRLQRLATGPDGLGLVELLRYRSAGLEADRTSCEQAVEWLRRTVRLERRSGGPPRQVEVVEEVPAPPPPPPPPKGFFAALMAFFDPAPAAPAPPQVRRTVEVPAPEHYLFFDGFGEEVTDGGAVTVVRLEPGRFSMGSPPGEEGRYLSEDRHEVLLTRSFLLGTVPVTQREYRAVLGYAIWRLPTEAEWEYACRAGTTSTHYGNLDDIAWHSGNAGGQTHPVRQKVPNAWGLYDMLGNVWEWCWDRRGRYPQGSVKDPIGANGGSERVSRGGSWYDDAEWVRATSRSPHCGDPGRRGDDLGFRLARSLPQAGGRTPGT